MGDGYRRPAGTPISCRAERSAGARGGIQTRARSLSPSLARHAEQDHSRVRSFRMWGGQVEVRSRSSLAEEPLQRCAVRSRSFDPTQWRRGAECGCGRGVGLRWPRCIPSKPRSKKSSLSAGSRQRSKGRSEAATKPSRAKEIDGQLGLIPSNPSAASFDGPDPHQPTKANPGRSPQRIGLGHPGSSWPSMPPDGPLWSSRRVSRDSRRNRTDWTVSIHVFVNAK